MIRSLPIASLWAAMIVVSRAPISAAQSPTPTLAPFSFGTPRLYAVGSDPVAVAAGHFDANAFLDLAVVNQGGDSVMQLNNDGTGRFNRVGSEYSTGAETFPSSIATLRKNSDAVHEMLIVCDATEAELEAQDPDFFGRADTIRAGLSRVNRRRVGESPVFVRAGVDLNANGSDDAVVANNADDTLTFLLNRTTFGDYSAQAISSVALPIAVAFGDFTGDGLPDIAALGEAGDLLVHRNLGGGALANPRFESCEIMAPGSSCEPRTIAVQPAGIEALHADIDGKLDLVIADAGANAVLFLRGKGNGTFEEPVVYELSESPEGIASADFNGDGRADVAVILPADDAIQVLLGRGDGTFDSGSPPFAAGASPSSLVAADLNNDGRVDVASASEIEDALIVVLNGVSPPEFTPTTTPTPKPPTLTPTRTRTRTATRTPTSSRTPSITPTRTASPTATQTSTASATLCPGDCNRDGVVSSTDVARLATIFGRCPECEPAGVTAAGCEAVPGSDKQCNAADINGDGCLTAGELTRAVERAASGGCD